jgi:hypothetical protein
MNDMGFGREAMARPAARKERIFAVTCALLVIGRPGENVGLTSQPGGRRHSASRVRHIAVALCQRTKVKTISSGNDLLKLKAIGAREDAEAILQVRKAAMRQQDDDRTQLAHSWRRSHEKERWSIIQNPENKTLSDPAGACC